VLESAQKHKVKRVVITSSISAIECLAPEVKGHNTFDENDWTDIVAWDCNAYVKSKTISEKSAWDFKIEQEK